MGVEWGLEVGLDEVSGSFEVLEVELARLTDLKLAVVGEEFVSAFDQQSDASRQPFKTAVNS